MPTSPTIPWVGSGPLAAASTLPPYFHVFNPVRQGEKFDPDGHYVRRWVPELRHLPDAWIRQPSQAPTSILKAAGVVLGETYPWPIVGHDQARKRALAALKQIKR